ncbi:MAG: GNAT family N-acetyltransferase [Candidatus Lokiarchaeota archaeon]|nr:GNAT family N-acetyltransferase [Candidatus Lokiarchaeota archaeon]
MSSSRLNLKKRKIRSYFLSVEKKDQKEDEVGPLEYIQMKLPVSEITPEFEEKLTKKAKNNILRAKIRESSEDDLPSVKYLYDRSWLTSQTPFSAISISSLKTLWEYPETIILIAKVYGSDAGFAILDCEGENQEFGVIAGMGIVPRFQRKGLGTVIGMAAWKYFKIKGVQELRCEVFKGNTVSYQFIKSIGFKEYDRKSYSSEDFLSES